MTSTFTIFATFLVGCILLGSLASAEVNCSTCTPLGTSPVFDKFTGTSVGFAGREGAFAFSAFDGRYFWMPPLLTTKSPVNRPFVIRLDPQDGSRAAFDFPATFTAPMNGGFHGAVYDTHGSVWFAPAGSGGYVVKLNTTDGSMNGHGNTVPGRTGTITTPTGAFAGGFFDGQNTGSKSGLWSWPAGYDAKDAGYVKFAGVAYDGVRAWLSPYDAPALISVHVATQVMTAFVNWPAGFTNQGAAFGRSPVIAGRGLWLPPRTATHLIRFDLDTNTMTGYTAWPSGFVFGIGFAEAFYDGEAVWLTPGVANQIVRVNATSGSMLGYTDDNVPQADWQPMNSVYDGQAIWLMPSHAGYVVKMVARFATLIPLATGSSPAPITSSPAPSVNSTP